MRCAYCDIVLDESDDYCQSGINGILFCSNACIQQAYKKGDYASYKVSPILKRYLYLTEH